jgi:hypothetical protein
MWLSTVADKASNMLGSGAYVHWYERYGFDRDDIQDCLERCRTVVQSYEELTRVAR